METWIVFLLSAIHYIEECMKLLYKEIPSFETMPFMSIHLNIPEGISESSILPMSWGKLFISSYFFNRKQVKKELKEDLKKQIDKTQAVIDKCIDIAKENNIEVKQKGIRLDSHIHTHLIPVVWESLIEVIEENNYEMEYIRNPKEPLIPFLKHFSLIPGYGLINIIKNRILMLYSKKVDRYCEEKEIAKMYMWGLCMSGRMDFDRTKEIYGDMLNKAQKDNRNLELLFHPGKATQEEYSNEMDKNYFRDANLSENRHIEKNTVMRIKEISNG